MKVSLSIIILLYIFFPLFWLCDLQGSDIIFISGACRSGKSSICSVIGKEDKWQALSSVYFPFSHELFGKQFPNEYTRILSGVEFNNARHAITKNFFLFKTDISHRERDKIRNSVKKIREFYRSQEAYTKHCEDFRYYSLQKIRDSFLDEVNVVTDLGWWSISRQDIQKISPSSKTFTVLIYSPFTTCLDRLITTNSQALESGNIMNFRFFSELLSSFSAMYELSENDDNAVDYLDKADFDSIAEIIMPYLRYNNDPEYISGFMLKEIALEEFKDYCRKIETLYRKTNRLYVRPKKQYDLIIDSSSKTPTQCSSEILSAFNEA